MSEIKPEVISNLPSLVIYGTNDAVCLSDFPDINFIKKWLPNSQILPIQNGNHLGFLAETSSDNYDSKLPKEITRNYLRKSIA